MKGNTSYSMYVFVVCICSAIRIQSFDVWPCIILLHHFLRSIIIYIYFLFLMKIMENFGVRSHPSYKSNIFCCNFELDCFHLFHCAMHRLLPEFYIRFLFLRFRFAWASPSPYKDCNFCFSYNY